MRPACTWSCALGALSSAAMRLSATASQRCVARLPAHCCLLLCLCRCRFSCACCDAVMCRVVWLFLSVHHALTNATDHRKPSQDSKIIVRNGGARLQAEIDAESGAGATDGDGMLSCRNAGCQAKFRESENTDTSCTHHSGPPVFHETYKWWSCCPQVCRARARPRLPVRSAPFDRLRRARAPRALVLPALR